jgi:hypothetical protein
MHSEFPPQLLNFRIAKYQIKILHLTPPTRERILINSNIKPKLENPQKLLNLIILLFISRFL